MSNASIALTDCHRRVLAEMGIDVWVRRGTASGSVAPEVHVEVERSPEPAAPPPPARPESTAGTAELRVSLDCIAAPGIVVIGDFANAFDQRLAQDVLLAIAGVNAKPQKAQFRWPQTQTGDSGIGAARNAYQGFLRGQIERANAQLLLLLGANAASLLNQDTKLAPETLRLPDVRALRADPNAKKQLWLSVSHRIPA
jgi:hypothetical protein